MLHYALYSNELTSDDPDDQVARPVDIFTRIFNDLVNQATGPGSILKPTEVQAVIDQYWRIIRGYTQEGESYSDDYISTRFDITGVFLNEDDRFDETRHSLNVSVKLKPIISKAVEDVQLKKVDARKSQPLIERVYDWGSDTTDSQLTPGAVLEIRGRQLKIYDNLVDEGVWFVNQDDESEVKADTVRTNEPKSLILKVPVLPAGDYKLEVRNTNVKGKTLKIGVFDVTLTVS